MLASCCWSGSSPNGNEWFTATRQALTPDSTTTTPSGRDRNRSPSPIRPTRSAYWPRPGFDEIDFTDVHEPVYYGPDAATAYADRAPPSARPRPARPPGRPAAESAHRRLRATLDAHDTGDGVLFDSRAWIVTARYP